MKSRIFPVFSLLSFGVWSTTCLWPHVVQAEVVHDPQPPLQLDLGHTTPLVAVAFAPDGTTVVSLSKDNEIRWRDGRSGKTRFLKVLPEPASDIRVMADSSLLTVGEKGALSQWQPPTLQGALTLRRRFEPPVPPPVEADATDRDTRPTEVTVQDCIPSADGSALGVVYIETTLVKRSYYQRVAVVRVFNVADGSVRHEWEPIAYESVPPRIGFADGAKTLLIAFPDHTVRWFDATTGAMQKEWQPPAEAAQQASDGAEEAAKRLQQLPPGLRDRIPHGRSDAMQQEFQKPEVKFGRSLAFSPDGSKLLSLTRLGFKVWDLKTGTAQLMEQSTLFSPAPVLWSPKGDLIAVRSSGGLWLWETSGTLRSRESVTPAVVTDIAFAPDGRSIAVADDSAQVRVWNTSAASNTTPNTVLAGYFEPIQQIVTAQSGIFATTLGGIAQISPTRPLTWLPLEAIQTPADYTPTSQQTVTALAASPDGLLLAETVHFKPYTGSMEGQNIPRGELRVRDANTGTILWRKSDSGRSALECLAWMPDNTLLTGKKGYSAAAYYVADSLEGLQRWDGKTGEARPLGIQWENRHPLDEPRGIEVLLAATQSPIVAAADSNFIRIINFRARQAIVGFDSGKIRETHYALSPDGHWLAEGTTRSVRIWDLTGQRQAQRLKLYMPLATGMTTGDSIEVVAFAPNGSLAAGLSDGRVLVWKPEFAQDAVPAWETETTGSAVQSLCFERSGTRLWSGDRRGELKERDATTGVLQSTLRLTPPKSAGANAGWVKWNQAGQIEKSP